MQKSPNHMMFYLNNPRSTSILHLNAANPFVPIIMSGIALKKRQHFPMGSPKFNIQLNTSDNGYLLIIER